MNACDFTTVETYLAVASACILAAIALLIAAAVLNNGFYTVAGSPVLMFLAGASLGGAFFAIGAAQDAATAYFNCLNTPGSCVGAFSNFMNSLAALKIVVSIQGIACASVALVTLIPWIGQAAIYPIIAALLVEVALIPAATAYFFIFKDCIASNQTATGTAVQALTVAVTIYISLGLYLVSRARKKYADLAVKRRKDDE